MITLKSTPSFLLILLVSVCLPTKAQEQTAELNALKPGAWALEFAIGSNFTLSAFQGSSISVKYLTSNTNAWRAGITISGVSLDNTNLSLPIQADTNTNSVSNSGSSSSEGVTLKVQYLWYFNTEGITHFYTGLGPRFDYSHNHTDQQNIIKTSSLTNVVWTNQTTSGTTNSWSVGASAIAGVEYFPAKLFSLHAEYSVSLINQRLKTESTTQVLTNSSNIYSNNKTSGSTTQWVLSNGPVSFGLSVYF